MYIHIYMYICTINFLVPYASISTHVRVSVPLNSSDSSNTSAVTSLRLLLWSTVHGGRLFGADFGVVLGLVLPLRAFPPPWFSNDQIFGSIVVLVDIPILLNHRKMKGWNEQQRWIMMDPIQPLIVWGLDLRNQITIKSSSPSNPSHPSPSSHTLGRHGPHASCPPSNHHGRACRCDPWMAAALVVVEARKRLPGPQRDKSWREDWWNYSNNTEVNIE